MIMIIPQLVWALQFLVLLLPVLIDLSDYPFSKVNDKLNEQLAYASIDFLDLLPYFEDQEGRLLWIQPFD